MITLCVVTSISIHIIWLFVRYLNLLWKNSIWKHFFSFIFSLFHFLSVQWEAFIGFLCFSNVFRVVCRRNKFNQIKIANRQIVKKNEKSNNNKNQKKKKNTKNVWIQRICWQRTEEFYALDGNKMTNYLKKERKSILQMKK